MRKWLLFFAAFSFAGEVSANVSLVGQLREVRKKVQAAEESLMSTLDDQTQASGRIEKLKDLLALQRKEHRLAQERLKNLQTYVSELESRRIVLSERISTHQKSIRLTLIDIRRSLLNNPKKFPMSTVEKFEAPRRRLLSKWVDRGFKEVEALKIDLADSFELENQIEKERQEVSYLFEELKERAALLKFHETLQREIFKSRYKERLAQLKNYRQLKESEGEVEKLIGQFNARAELQDMIEEKKTVSKTMNQGIFADQKGMLPFPVAGKILSAFGPGFDTNAKLQVFKKGIQISSSKASDVKAVFSGRVVYSGKLPGYGLITIIDHGAHYYSLCGNLGVLDKKVGDLVTQGESVGKVDDAGSPVYFEIRAHNVAVNPLQWLVN